MVSEPIAIIAQDFPRVVIPLIESAEESIRIVVFDWRWYPSVQGSQVSKFNQAIVNAVLRGVKVQCLVNNEGVKSRLLAAGAEAKILHSKKMLHTKMLLVDGRKIVIGSHNYTQHAFSMNEEASILVDLGTQENQFVQYFTALWGL
jgi:phosphatidylserine/phosphatidylglycerophosphate/cardiolipin synthase-like enzyme